jgi:hypothetical protein
MIGLGACASGHEAERRLARVGSRIGLQCRLWMVPQDSGQADKPGQEVQNVPDKNCI